MIAVAAVEIDDDDTDEMIDDIDDDDDLVEDIDDAAPAHPEP